MTDTEDLVWIQLHVEMGRNEAQGYVSIPRTEWDAMTEGEQETYIDEAVQDHISNNVSAGGLEVDASDVPDDYR